VSLPLTFPLPASPRSGRKTTLDYPDFSSTYPAPLSLPNPLASSFFPFSPFVVYTSPLFCFFGTSLGVCKGDPCQSRDLSQFHVFAASWSCEFSVSQLGLSTSFSPPWQVLRRTDTSDQKTVVEVSFSTHLSLQRKDPSPLKLFDSRFPFSLFSYRMDFYVGYRFPSLSGIFVVQSPHSPVVLPPRKPEPCPALDDLPGSSFSPASCPFLFLGLKCCL